MKIKYSETFNKWLMKLKDINAKTRIITRLRRIEATNNLGDYKSLGNGLYEIRIDYAVGYRLYFIYDGDNIIIILAGGDKSTQQKDIVIAKNLIIK